MCDTTITGKPSRDISANIITAGKGVFTRFESCDLAALDAVINNLTVNNLSVVESDMTQTTWINTPDTNDPGIPTTQLNMLGSNYDASSTLIFPETTQTGPGTRLVFNPADATLRAGTVDGTQWDMRGMGSVAVGVNNSVRGDYSMASGIDNTVISTHSAAVGGDGNMVSDPYAIVLGMSGIMTDQDNTTYTNRIRHAGGTQQPVLTINGSDTTLGLDDFSVAVTTGGADRTVSLPTTAVVGQEYIIKNVDGTNILTIDSGVGNIINPSTGTAGQTLDLVMVNSVHLVCVQNAPSILWEEFTTRRDCREPFIVGSDSECDFATIQDALTAATATGIPQTITVRAGTYAGFTMENGHTVRSTGLGTVFINTLVTVPAPVSVSFFNSINFQGGVRVLGTTRIDNCVMDSTTGFTLRLESGSIVEINDSRVNSAGGTNDEAVEVLNATLRATNTIFRDTAVADDGFSLFITQSSNVVCTSCTFEGSMTYATTSTSADAKFYNCEFDQVSVGPSVGAFTASPILFESCTVLPLRTGINSAFTCGRSSSTTRLHNCNLTVSQMSAFLNSGSVFIENTSITATSDPTFRCSGQMTFDNSQFYDMFVWIDTSNTAFENNISNCTFSRSVRQPVILIETEARTNVMNCTFRGGTGAPQPGATETVQMTTQGDVRFLNNAVYGSMEIGYDSTNTGEIVIHNCTVSHEFLATEPVPNGVIFLNRDGPVGSPTFGTVHITETTVESLGVTQTANVFVENSVNLAGGTATVTLARNTFRTAGALPNINNVAAAAGTLFSGQNLVISGTGLAGFAPGALPSGALI